MTTKQDDSSFGTIIFKTNIPGDKEHTLDPTIISYSDNPDLKITKTTNKLYYYNDKIINPSFFTNLKRKNILNILFNKNRFEKRARAHFNASDDLQPDQIITKNIMSYIENIFTTFPKSYNIKNIANAKNSGGLKLTIPFTSIPYTYLKVNGTDHTVSRVVYYNDKDKDDISLEILNDYSEFNKWATGKKNEKVFKEPLVKNFKKLFETTTKTNLINTFGKKTETKPKFDEIILAYKEHIVKIKEYIRQSDNTPSSMWGVNQLNKNFFTTNKTSLFINSSEIMKKINNVIKQEIETKENKAEIEEKIKEKINKVIEQIKKSDEVITQNGNSIYAKDKSANTFKGYVKPLLKEIEQIIGEALTNSEALTNKLWLDEVTETQNTSGKIQAEKENLTEVELKEKIKQYNDKIASLESHKTEYNEYYDKDYGSLMIAKIMSNLSDYDTKGTVKSARIDEEVNNFRQSIITIFESYKALFNIHQTKTYTDGIIEQASNACRIISDQLKEIKRPDVLNPSIIPSHKFKEIIVLLDSFLIHSDIYTSFTKKMYDTDLLDSKYSKYNEYKQYIDFIRKIKKIYEYNDEFELSEIQNMINNGELVKVSKDSGFENETIRLHIDLIKGKINDDNIKQFNCAYKDYDLVERWNKLDEIPDDDVKLEPLYYFKLDDIKVNDPKQIKKGGKRTRKRRRKKGAHTRKR